MQIELPVFIDSVVQNRVYASEQVLEAYAGPAQETSDGIVQTTMIELTNGQTRMVALSYADYRQRGYDAQYVYTYNEGTVQV